MHSLFLKIVLWFVLALGLMITMLLLFVAVTRLQRPFEAPFKGTWPRRAQLAASILEHHGPPMLAEYLQTLELAFRTQAYLFAENGEEALGQATPLSATRLAKLASHTGRMELQGAGRERLLAQPATGPSGHRYVLVLLADFPTRMIALGTLSIAQAAPLLPLLLIAGCLCWWLARHITTPVLQLRAASRQLADGKLEARVGGVVTHRHDELAGLGHQFDQMAERLEALQTSQQLLFRTSRMSSVRPWPVCRWRLGWHASTPVPRPLGTWSGSNAK